MFGLEYKEKFNELQQAHTELLQEFNELQAQFFHLTEKSKRNEIKQKRKIWRFHLRKII